MPPASDRPKLLLAGDAAVPTGFARLIHGVFSRLTDRWEIAQLGVNHLGDPHDWPWPIYRAGLYGGVFGIDRIAALAGHLRPDVVVLVSDLSVVGEWADALAAWPGRAHTPVVAYVPVERGPLHPAHVRGAAAVDLLLCYTEFGASELRRGAERERERHPDFSLPAVEVIPHGVDTALFRPVRGNDAFDRGPVRRKLFGDDSLRSAFIVLNANRNQLRKRIDVTIKGFSLFAEGKPEDVLLYLHMGRIDVGWDVLELARRFGIEERLVMSGKEDGIPNLPGEEVNAIYNACDVGVNTASGEGWGLVAFEHAATGAAQVVPAHSAPAELWRGAAELLETDGTLTNPDNLEEDWIIRPETLAAALERLYADRAHLREMSRRAYENATRAEYGWTAVAHRWDAALRRALEMRGRRPGGEAGAPATADIAAPPLPGARRGTPAGGAPRNSA